MKQEVADERLIKQYLLGEVTHEQQSQVQDRLLTDPQFFKLLLVLENELTDEYLGGGLSENELERFDSYFFAAPERRQKLKFAKALNKYVANAAAHRSQQSLAAPVGPLNWWRHWRDLIRFQNRLSVFSLGTAALVLAAAGASLILYRAGVNYEVAQVRDENAPAPAPPASQIPTQTDSPSISQSNPDAAKKAPGSALKSPRARPPKRELKVEREPTRSLLIKPPATKPPGPQGPTEPAWSPRGALPLSTLRPALTLTAGAGDIGAAETAEIIATTQQLSLQLTIEDAEHPGVYGVELKTAEGESIWRAAEYWSRRTPSGSKAVVVSVPAKLLVSNDYILSLRSVSKDGGHERVATYYFRVIRK